MAVKTITIDMEAYELLSRQKEQGESFSKVIKRCLKTPTGRDLARAIEAHHLDESTLDEIDRVIAARHEDRARPTDL